MHEHSARRAAHVLLHFLSRSLIRWGCCCCCCWCFRCKFHLALLDWFIQCDMTDRRQLVLTTCSLCLIMRQATHIYGLLSNKFNCRLWFDLSLDSTRPTCLAGVTNAIYKLWLLISYSSWCRLLCSVTLNELKAEIWVELSTTNVNVIRQCEWL